MQAAFYERTGPAQEVLRTAEISTPEPGAGEVHVRLRWSGVNPSDVKSRAGLRSSVMPFPRVVPHSDGMGIVDAVGAAVTAARIGERVWIWNGAWGRAMGTAAQYICLPQAQAVALPASVDDAAGACLGIPALTALHAVLMAGGVQGQRVMVAGGAGAVGHYAVQFAKLLGAQQVLATTSTPAKAALAKAAGADVCIHYRDNDAAAQIREATKGEGVDRIIELDIAANTALNLAVLRPGGAMVVYGSGAPKFELPFFPLIVNNISLHFFIVYNLSDADRARAEEVLHGFLTSGALQHNIAARFNLNDIVQAHDCVEQGQAAGNVVVEVR
jgi:NADPH:quinone reductase